MTDQSTSEPPLEPLPPLGVAGNMARVFIHSPLSLLLLIAMLFMGIMGLVFTPRQEDPQISVPMVDIFIQYPGASAQQVASLAINPLQRIMSEIPAVEHVYSAAERGQGMVTVQFEVGEQLEHSIFKVHDKLQSNMDKIPPGVALPLVKPKGIDDVPVVTLTLWSEQVDDGALRTIALDVTQTLKEIPNTGQSFVVGGRAEQVKVEIIPERLSSFNISLGQVANTIQTANSEKNAGYIETGNFHFTVYTGSFLRTKEDVERLVVGTFNDSPIYVRDLAKVEQGREEPQQMVNYLSGHAYNYKPNPIYATEEETAAAEVAAILSPKVAINNAQAVTIAIAKKIGTNGVTVADDIIEHVRGLIKNNRIIPKNVRVEITRNYGETANDKVNELILKLFIATAAVTVLILWSFRHIKKFGLPGLAPATVVLIVIPVVILITVFSAWVLGFTIDRVSLFALIFSIGILVDDAIVVIENIYRRWLLRGETDTETAVDAVREVGNPTILATFTVIAALLPMGFVSGMMGPYMAPIPALGSVAMLFSLLAAFIFTPWLAMRVKPSIASLQRAEEKEHHFNEQIEGFFRTVLPPLINNRFLGMLFLIGLIIAFFAACSMFYTTAVQVKMLPLDNKPEFNVFIDMPEGTALPVTANITNQIAEKLRKIPEVTALQTYVGTSQPFDFNGMVRHYYLRGRPWQADIHIQLTHKRDRERSSHEIAVEARRTLQELTKTLTSPAKLTVVEMPPGPPVLQSIVAEVYGPDQETRRTVAKKLTDAFETANILDDVDNYIPEPYKTWRFQVDAEKSVRRGISVDTINQNLAMALGGFKVGDVKKGTFLEPTYIVIQVPLSERAQLTRLYDLPIPNQMGGTVPLSELGTFVQEPEDTVLFQKDLRPVEFVVGEAVGVYQGDNQYRLSAPIYGMFEIENLLKTENYITPDGVALHAGHYIGPPKTDAQSGFEWTGEWTVTYETFRDMGLAFGAAMVLIYILVVWEFGNFIVPAVIMAPIPLTLLGIIPGHWIKDAEFTATSMIGWIALAGIIVRNSILLVDYSIHEVLKGTDIQDAVILACKTRTRPIMITALALVAGSFVILDDPIFEGMAISLMAGVLVSTLLTLIVIPLGCISIGPDRLCSTGMSKEDTYLTPIPANLIAPAAAPPPATPLWFSLWSGVIGFVFTVVKVVTMIFYAIRAIFIIAGSIFSSLLRSNKPAAVAPSPSPPPAETVVSKPESATIPQPTLPVETQSPSPPPAERMMPIMLKEDAVLSEEMASSREEEEIVSKSAEIVAESKSEEKNLVKKPTAKKLGRRGIRLKSDLRVEDSQNKSEHPQEDGDFKPNGNGKDKK